MHRAMKQLLLLLCCLPALAQAQISTPSAPVALTVGGGTTVTSGSHTPTGDSLQLAFVCVRDFEEDAFTGFSSTYSTGGWTTLGTPDYYGAPASDHTVMVAAGWAIADSSPGAGTVTATFGGSANAAVLFLVEIDSGFDAATPIAQHKYDGTETDGTTFTSDLDSAPDSASMLVSAVGAGWVNATSDISPDTGWTEIEQQLGNKIPCNTQYVAGSNGTQFGATFDVTENTLTGVAVEVQEPSGGGSAIVPIIMQQLH